MYRTAPRSFQQSRFAAVPAAPYAPVEIPYRRDALRIALMIILLLSVGRMQESLTFLMPLRLGLVCTGIALGYSVMRRSLLVDGPLLQTWPAKVIVGIIVLACVGAPFGLSLGASATFLLDRFSKVLVFVLLLIAGIRGTRDLRWFVWGYVVAAAYLCYLAVFVADVTSYYGSAVDRINGEALGAYDANDIGVVLTMSIPLALLTMQTSRRKGAIFSFLVLAAIGAAIAVSGSRGGFLGVIAVGAGLLVYLSHIPVAKRIGAVVLIAGTLVLTAPPGYWAQMRTIIEPDADYNRTAEDGRIEVWKRGVGYMLRYPVFGVGIGNFSRAEGTISEKARNHVEGTGLRFTAAHNSFVQVGAETGPVGLVLWSSLIVGGIISMHRLRRRLPRQWLHGDQEQRFLYLMTLYLPVSFIAFSVTGFFVSFAYSPPVFILAAFVSGMYVSVNRRLAMERAFAEGAQPMVSPPLRPVPRWAARHRSA